MSKKIHTGLALILIWFVAFSFAMVIIFRINNTDFSYLYIPHETIHTDTYIK
jgi:cytochrome c-type biogenesis protein CcmE